LQFSAHCPKTTDGSKAAAINIFFTDFYLPIFL
jgi:hypothetical protein